MSSRPLFISVAESIVILPPIAQVGCASASLDGDVLELGARAPAERAARGGERQAVDRPGRLAARAAGAARSARSRRAGSARRSPRRAAVTSSPPTTSDSLLASARSIPSPSVATVGPRPAEPTSALRTRSAPDSSDQPHEPLGRRRAPRRPVHASAARAPASGSASAIRVDAVLARLRDERLPGAPGGQADELQVLGALDDVERLGADRAGRAQDEQTPRTRPF